MAHNISADELQAIFSGLDVEFPPDPLDTLTEALNLREVTTEELAAVLGVSDRRIAQLWQNGIISHPRKEKKRYYFPLLRCIAEYIRFLKER